MDFEEAKKLMLSQIAFNHLYPAPARELAEKQLGELGNPGGQVASSPSACPPADGEKADG